MAVEKPVTDKGQELSTRISGNVLCLMRYYGTSRIYGASIPSGTLYHISYMIKIIASSVTTIYNFVNIEKNLNFLPNHKNVKI